MTEFFRSFRSRSQFGTEFFRSFRSRSRFGTEFFSFLGLGPITENEPKKNSVRKTAVTRLPERFKSNISSFPFLNIATDLYTERFE